jgi:excisionase family DNA binding protein
LRCGRIDVYSLPKVAEELLTVEEVARLAKLSAKTVWREIGRGNLRAHKLSGRWRIRTEDCQGWIDRAAYAPGKVDSRPHVPPSPSCGSLAALRRIESEAA